MCNLALSLPSRWRASLQVLFTYCFTICSSSSASAILAVDGSAVEHCRPKSIILPLWCEVLAARCHAGYFMVMFPGCCGIWLWIRCSDTQVLGGTFIGVAFHIVLVAGTMVVVVALCSADGGFPTACPYWLTGSHCAQGIVSDSFGASSQWWDGYLCGLIELVWQPQWYLVGYVGRYGWKGRPSHSWLRSLTAAAQFILPGWEFCIFPGGGLRLDHFSLHASTLLASGPAQGTSVLRPSLVLCRARDSLGSALCTCGDGSMTPLHSYQHVRFMAHRVG